MNWGFGSYTINETLSNVVGYFVAAFLALYFCGLVYAHFDQKRRMYKMVDRILNPVFNGVLGLLGVREKMKLSCPRCWQLRFRPHLTDIS